MPAKKQTKPPGDESAAGVAISPRGANDPAPTAVSLVSDSPLATKHTRTSRSAYTPKVVGYESPLKKLKKTMSHHKQRKVIDTIDGLRDFIKHNDVTQKEVRDSICIQGRFLWSAAESNGNYHFLRLYLGEQQAPEPLYQQQQEFQAAQREDAFETNQYLITVSLYEVASNDPNLPVPGAVISFSPTKASIYRNCCQVNAKLAGISTINVP